MRYQTVTTRSPNRADHVWLIKPTGARCVLCGAVCDKPPLFPTPVDWLPDRYELLTPEDRKLCPNPVKK